MDIKRKLEFEKENKSLVGLKNDVYPNKTEAQLEADLERHASPEAIFSFVRMHFNQDDGNDTPPTTAEMEAAFTAYIHSLGYRGEKVAAFIKRAVQSIDDYDHSDKYDNIKQSYGTNHGGNVYKSEIDEDLMAAAAALNINSSPTPAPAPPAEEMSFKEKNKNNPFYIDPNSPPRPY